VLDLTPISTLTTDFSWTRAGNVVRMVNMRSRVGVGIAAGSGVCQLVENVNVVSRAVRASSL
jgi:hypothetical protein